MRKILASICTLAAIVALSSCNLFIDDAADDDNPYNVPLHEGVGYDEAVSVSDGAADVTYKYKRDVRHVSDEEARRWVRYVEYDGSTALIEVHYDAQTPEELLPVKGEILLCNDMSLFKWGCMHRITNRTRQGDVYVLVGILVNLDEAFDQLNIRGNVNFGDTTLYNADGEVYDLDEEADRSRPRRAVDVEHIDPFNFDIYCGDLAFQSTFGINYPEEYSVEYGVLSGTVRMSKDENYIRVTDQMVFGDESGDFSLDHMVFSIIEAVEQHWQIEFDGQVELSWKKKFKFGKLFPRRYLIGGVVPMNIWMHLQLEISASVSASLTLGKSKTTVKKCTFNLTDGTSTGYHDYTEPIEVNGHVIKAHETELELGGELPSFEFHITASIPITLGFYGKILAINIEPYFTPIELTIPSYPTAKTDYRFSNNAYRPYDTTEEKAIVLEGRAGVKLSAAIDMSVDALLGLDDDDSDELKKATDLTQLKKMIEEKDPSLKEFTESPTDEASLDFSDKMELFSLDIYANLYKVEFPIFPRLKPGSLRTIKWWNDSRKRMTYQAEYTIQDAGAYHTLFGRKLQPALLMVRGSRIVRLYLPNGVNKDAKVDSDIADKTYVFDIDAREDDKEYLICAAYLATYAGYILDQGNKHYLQAMDKLQAYNLTSPSATLVEVLPVKVTAVQNHLYTDKYNGKYPWTVSFYFDTWTHAVGVANMSSFGVIDTNKSSVKHTYNASKDKKNMKDGYYLFHFTKKVNTWQNSYSQAQFSASLASFYEIDDEQHHYSYTSDPTTILFGWGTDDDQAVCSVKSPFGDEAVEYYVPKQRIPYSANNSRQRRSYDLPVADDDDGDLELLSIEDADGNIVWQRDI